jgi:transposase
MILAASRRVRVFADPKPVDLRKGFDGLYGLVTHAMGYDVLGGDVFLLGNRCRKSCKVLVWDGTGLCIFQKRLERGRFARLWRDDGTAVRLTTNELALVVEGCDLVGRQALSPAAVVVKPLASDSGT